MKSSHKWTLIAGIICVCGGPLAGLFITVISIIMSFHALGQNGISDPSGLAANIGNALIATEIGIVSACLGLSLIIASLAHHFAGKKKRSS